GKILERAYWVPEFKTDSKIDFETAKTRVRELVTKAVERRMVADVPVGNYLSGGLDSTLVCALMSQRTSKLKSFNVGFGGTIYDESVLAGKIAGHFGANFETFDCHNALMAENLTATLRHMEKPIANSNSVGKFLLSRLVNSQGYKVVLTGEGADEIFGGYPFFKLEKIWRLKDKRKQKELWKRFQQMEARSEGFLWQKGNRWKSVPPIFGYSNVQHVRIDESSDYVDEMLHPRIWLESKYRTPAEYLELEPRPIDPRTLDPFNASRYLSFPVLSCYIIPTLGDRGEMAHSVEGRTPFLDRDLVKFALTVPPEHFMDIDRLREKHLLREAFADLLPDFTRKEHKHPFSTANWYFLFQTPAGRELFHDYLSWENVKRTEIFQPEFVRLMKIIWKAVPRSAPLWRKIDASLGIFITTLILYRELILNSQPRRPVKIVDRTWKNDMKRA
ncbi:MAG: asparagine synthase C-terminal domain-containing protein, partial [Bdellovibrionia bacterium]